MDNYNNNFIQRVRDFAYGQNLFAVENIIVGVSGGPDSMALITALYELSKCEEDFPNLYAVHVNHGIREDDAINDQKMVEKYCSSLGISCTSYIYDIPAISKDMGRSLEETGRIMRYKVFDEVAKSICGDDYETKSYIAVAHHRDDVSETMLMNLFRGSGLDGLVSPRSISGRIIRPLLCVTKNDILNYLDASDINYAIDYTNGELDCTRNIWRNKVIPSIREVSVKDPEEALNDTYELLREDSDFIESIASDVYDKNVIRCGSWFALPIDVVTKAHKAISSRLIRRLRKDNYGSLVNFGTVHLNLVYKFIEAANQSTMTLDMPFGTICYVMSGYIGFCGNAEDVQFIACEVARKIGVIALSDDVHTEIAIKSENATKIPNSSIQIKTQIFENIDGLEYNGTSWFIPIYEGEITGVVAVNGLSKRKFTRAGSLSGKSLGKVMSDMHIPRDARDRVVGICYGEDYLWIPGIGHTNGFVSSKSFDAWRKANPTPVGYLRIEIIGG